MTDWTVTIDVEIAAQVTDELIFAVHDELVDLGGSVSGLDHRISAVMTISNALGVLAAVDAGAGALTAALANNGHFAHARAAEAITVDEHDRRLAEPTIPDLAGASEAAEILGVSRQRIHQLHHENPGFPTPVVEVRMGPLWTRASIEAFDRSWARRVGRPPAHQLA